ncbi:MAG: DNA integrity scanning protein DisA nucleotide-binding domain protein [candidate division Zixibacteria bacterium]|nr:DNA integrity scanning protein DisA nucleotide-binding domain protein [candidate division Zixibacteria bacterium]
MSESGYSENLTPILEKEKFRQLVSDNLLPLFSGARLKSGTDQAKRNSEVVAFRGHQCALGVKPRKDADYRVVIERSQPFADLSSTALTEHEVASAFVSSLEEIQDGIGTNFEEDLLTTIKRRIVAKAVSSSQDQERSVLRIIDQLAKWSTSLYEGNPISAAYGIEDVRVRRTVHLEELWHEKFSPVMTNGYDTILISNYNGQLVQYLPLAIPPRLPPYAPLRVAAVASWSIDKPGRTALLLNRLGEILIIKDGQLVFTRRSGNWHFMVYSPVITQMGCPQNKSVRRAILESCLDASFARTGACIGVMVGGEESKLAKELAPNKKDHIRKGKSVKARFVHRISKGKEFQKLDRRLRQELLAIDGATILDYQGRILAVGAILKVTEGSSAGGRHAAAIKLGKFGLGIKVSEDGGIEAYHRPGKVKDPKPTFNLMSSSLWEESDD